MNKLHSLLARLLGISKTLWEFFAPFLRENVAQILTVLLPIAVEVVRSLDADPRSNDDKRREAIKRLGREAQIEGLRVTEGLLAYVVEHALRWVRLTQPTRP